MTASDDALLLADPSALEAALARTLASARYRVDIRSEALDPRLYAGESVVSACKRFMLGTSRARLRILLGDTQTAARGHRLVELGRHLSSYCEFRVLAERDAPCPGELIMVDETALLWRDDARAPVAYEQHSPRATRLQRRRFDDLWHAGRPASELRALHFG